MSGLTDLMQITLQFNLLKFSDVIDFVSTSSELFKHSLYVKLFSHTGSAILIPKQFNSE